MIDRLREDVRVAFRGFRRAPTFVATAVMILGLGIGMATAMWSVVDAVLLRGSPIRDVDRIVVPRSVALFAVCTALFAVAFSAALVPAWRVIGSVSGC